VRPSTLVLVGLGLALLAVGVWVEDRAAVAAPLVIIGALVVVVGVVFEAWADIEEMSVSQAGLTFKRRAPSAEQLTEGGLPSQVADALEQWLEDVTRLLPAEVDKRVSKALARSGPLASRPIDALLRREALRRMQTDYGTGEPEQKPPEPGPGAA
jgi:hypothetical protein